MRRGGEALLWLVVASCGDTTGGEVDTGTTALSIFATDTSVPTEDSAPKLDVPTTDLGEGACGPINGDLGLSYIWIANSTQGTISKIDTVDLVERGRYIVRP